MHVDLDSQRLGLDSDNTVTHSDEKQNAKRLVYLAGPSAEAKIAARHWHYSTPLASCIMRSMRFAVVRGYVYFKPVFVRRTRTSFRMQ